MAVWQCLLVVLACAPRLSSAARTKSPLNLRRPLPVIYERRHHKAALVQQAHHGVFNDANVQEPPPDTNVQQQGMIYNTGSFQDEALPPPQAPPAALVASQATAGRYQASEQSQAQAVDDNDGGDASQLIDNAGSDAGEALTREDIIEGGQQQAAALQREAQSAPMPQVSQMQTMPAQVQPAAVAQPDAASQPPIMPAAQASLATMGSSVTSKTSTGAGQPTGVTRPKGWDQCLKFARYVKSQDVTGVELVRVWKSTCEPAVQSGSATERYRLMCNSLGGAVEPFAAQLDYNVENLCDSVLAVFHDVTAVDTKAR